MKRNLATLVMAFGLGSMILTSPTFAQNHPAVADVPFAFVLSGETLPAGKYNVSQFTNGAPVFSVRNANGVSRLVMMGAPETGHPAHPSLTFAQYEGQWILVKVTPPDSVNAYSLGRKWESKYEPRKMKLAALVSVKLQ